MDLDGSPFVDLPRSAYVTEGALSGRIHPGLAASRVSLPTGAGGREQATNRGRLLAWAISTGRGVRCLPRVAYLFQQFMSALFTDIAAVCWQARRLYLQVYKRRTWS